MPFARFSRRARIPTPGTKKAIQLFTTRPGMARPAEKLEALLEGGADPTLRNNAGKLPWDYARANEALRESSVLERLRPSEGLGKSNPFAWPGGDGRVR